MMDFGGFVVQGSRPPSVQSNHRPGSARSKHGYHTIAYQSSVDETLFSSHHPSKIHEPVTEFKAPWDYPKPKAVGHTFSESKAKQDVRNSKTKPKGRPLLWAPTPGTSIHKYLKKDNKNTSSHSSINDANRFWNSRDHFRHLKHTPTFVDESLFGSKLEELSFEAPWNEKLKKGKISGAKNFSFWDSKGSSGLQIHNGLHIDLPHDKYSPHERPKTALGLSRERNNGSNAATKAVPVWKP